MTPRALEEAEQQQRREWFRRRFTDDIAFNRLCRLDIPVWTPECVQLRLPFAEILTSSGGFIHGGVLSALVDVAGSGAVLAGHDFRFGSRVVTASMSLQFLAAVERTDVLATGICTRRGRTSFADIRITDAATGQLVVSGHASYLVAGERSEAPWI